MAHTITNDAELFTIDQYGLQPSICRDDNGDYWTVIRTVAETLDIYKSEDGGSNWTLKKSVSNSDFDNGDPLPTNKFKIINLAGEDKVYVFLQSTSTALQFYGWIFNVTADTNQKDLDAYSISSTCHPTYSQIDWNSYNNTLLICMPYNTTSAYRSCQTFKINLDSTITKLNHIGNYIPGDIVDYCVNNTDGTTYQLGLDVGNNIFRLFKTNSTGSYLDMVTIDLTGITVSFSQINYDSNEDAILIYFEEVNKKFTIRKRDTDDLNTELYLAENTVSFIPTSMCSTIDGNDNVYIFYTNPDDGEAYYIKYDPDADSWNSPVKLSSDNDGKLISCEKKPPLAATKIIFSYQATS